MLHQTQHVAGVTVLVVVPGYDLDESAIQCDTGFGIEGGGCAVTTEVGGNDLFVGVSQHTLECTLGGGLHGLADVFVSGFLIQLHRQIDHGHVGGGNAESHAGQLFVELGDNLADGLGGASRRRNDIFQNAATTAPIFHGRAVNGLLGGSGGMHGGHQATLDAPVVVQHFGDWGQAVGGAGGCGNDGFTGVFGVVYAIHEHRGVVLGRCGLDHLLGTGFEVCLAGFCGQEETGAIDHDVRARFVPLQVGGITLGRQTNFLAVNNHAAAVNGDIAIEAAMHGVVLQHVSQVFGLQQVIDGDDFDVFEVLRYGAEYHAADTAKTIDTDFNCHVSLLNK